MKKIINYSLALLILTFILNSCEVDKTEPVFSDPPAVRIANKISELRTLLLSQEQGFSGVYFPNNSVVGGISFHMNFSEDLRVKMTSDFKVNTSLTDTRYDIVTGTTAAELVFTSGTRHITDLVQDGAEGFDSFFGNNSFQYVGEENGVITFREVRNDGVFVLSPSGFTDFDTESVASTNATFASKQDFVAVDCATTSVFNSLAMKVVNNGVTTDYLLSYNPDNLFVNAETTDGQGVTTNKGFGVAFTLISGQLGLAISPALEVGGVSFENFTLNTSASGIEYVSTVNGVTATILYDSVLIPSGEDIFELPGATYFYDIADGSNPLTSTCFDQLVIGQINASLDARFGPGVFKFSFFAFFLNFTSDSCLNQLSIWVENAAGATFRANYCFTRATIQNNRLYQDYTGAIGGNGTFLEQNLMPLIEFFNSSQGLIYTNEGSFRASINNYSNLSGTFTSMDDEALRVYGLFF